ncbi:MAG: acyl-CoA dehydrogenase family protein [Candidatus Marinimicrobia bacterium]|nr:acyl-CoA dehydrogenase family protein [Candidatus Neomarinimicrobiota bacterium]MDP6615410.1 acyl-CoA dehydrogenase family protein [Candidatus Neomarinimicrobiota bacterium]MDP6820621.1 acyl-CoA dehydrogenase family protein [Candidatus Neomarinimicrobiota bacterium]MEC8899692.1 acyl-CoA dehydrogenase family protein [Candidatus Neomarinimicrobiota bacterium]MED5316126.1 acyl-CoA dehydrogenase family protein [Candidatus Neomarinimicrobiota bacterium]
MDFTLTEDQELIQKTAREFAVEHLAPGVMDRDENAEFPYEQIKLMGELGFMGMMVPEEYSGAGMDTLTYVIALEEIAAVEAAASTIMSVNNSLVCQLLADWGTNVQKDQYLKTLASGIKLGAYSLSEPQSGSDASNLRTHARRKNGHYIINGTKNWVTNGINSDIVVMFCLTDKDLGSKGISAFIVDKGMAGFSTGKKEDKLGIRASDTCELYFEDCEVPVENRIGEEGAGFKIAMNTLGGGRIGIAAQGLGIARAALEAAVSYAGARKQFGKTIGSFGAIQNKLANTATEIDAARLLIWRAAKLKDRGKPYVKESSMAKLYASTVAMKAATDCVQIYGGYGYMREYGVERLMRDAKITQIYEGTSEIQQLVIGRELMK